MKKWKIAVAAFIIMCALSFPSLILSAATCGETVRQNTEEALKAVDYENNDQIAELLAPSRYYSYEVTNKKLEIAQRGGRNFLDISDDEAKLELNKEKFLIGLAYVKRLYNFNMGDKNICDVLLYEPGTYGVWTDVVDWIIKSQWMSGF